METGNEPPHNHRDLSHNRHHHDNNLETVMTPEQTLGQILWTLAIILAILDLMGYRV